MNQKQSVRLQYVFICIYYDSLQHVLKRKKKERKKERSNDTLCMSEKRMGTTRQF